MTANAAPWIALLGLLFAVLGLWFYRRRLDTHAQAEADTKAVPRGGAITTSRLIQRDAPISFQTPATKQLDVAVHSLAFGVRRFDYHIVGPHRKVFDAVNSELRANKLNHNELPRKPALLPRLLQTLNSEDATRREIVDLVLQDPVLAGNVLKRANSAYYRTSIDAIDSIDNAVAVLGIEGLRAPVTTAVMQPVFAVPRGLYPMFAPTTWEFAQRAAHAAEAQARIGREDAFVAHLIGLLIGLGRIVVFRTVQQQYRRTSNLLPRAEVFVEAIQENEPFVSRQIAASWDMSPVFLDALQAQVDKLSPSIMSPLARTLYYSNLIGAAALLTSHSNYDPNEARKIALDQGIDAAAFDAAWLAASES